MGVQPSRVMAANALEVASLPAVGTVGTVATVPTVPPVDTPTATETSVGNTPTATATETAVGNTPTATATETAVGNTPTATVPATATATETTVGNTPTATVTPTPSVTPVVEIKQYYVSSSSNSKVDDVRYSDEDILLYDIATDTWSMIFDGSDVKVGRTDVDAFHMNADGTILMSFVHPVNFPAPLGKVDDSDIVKFIPTQLGETTAGTFELYFDGSDVGLATGNEDIDAFGLTADGRLLISTYGRVEVPGVSGRDEDLLAFTPTSLGDNTQGTWELYFDGSDVDLTLGSEDVGSAFVHELTGDLYMTTRANYTAVSNNTVSGDYNDIFRCVAQSLGDTTVCTFANIFNGDAARFFTRIDGITIKFGPVTANNLLTVQSADLLNDDLPQYDVDADDLDYTDDDVDEFDTAQEADNTQLWLPTINNAVINRGESLPLP